MSKIASYKALERTPIAREIAIWTAILTITISISIYHRITGPTNPVSDTAIIDETYIEYKFQRSHCGPDDHRVSINLKINKDLKADLFFKRYNTKDNWKKLPMKVEGNSLSAYLPHQPEAGKLIYFVKIASPKDSVIIPKKPVLIRFKGSVPSIFLIPHIVFMFLSLASGLRIGLSIILKTPCKNLVFINFIFILIGGMILGPIVQKYAFGTFWAGFPLGNDLTDNKMLITFIFWLLSIILIRKEKIWRIVTAAAVIVLIISHLIPHSMWGSEYDYSTNKVITGRRK